MENKVVQEYLQSIVYPTKENKIYIKASELKKAELFKKDKGKDPANIYRKWFEGELSDLNTKEYIETKIHEEAPSFKMARILNPEYHFLGFIAADIVIVGMLLYLLANIQMILALSYEIKLCIAFAVAVVLGILMAQFFYGFKMHEFRNSAMNAGVEIKKIQTIPTIVLPILTYLLGIFTIFNVHNFGTKDAALISIVLVISSSGFRIVGLLNFSEFENKVNSFLEVVKSTKGALCIPIITKTYFEGYDQIWDYGLFSEFTKDEKGSYYLNSLNRNDKIIMNLKRFMTIYPNSNPCKKKFDNYLFTEREKTRDSKKRDIDSIKHDYLIVSKILTTLCAIFTAATIIPKIRIIALVLLMYFSVTKMLHNESKPLIMEYDQKLSKKDDRTTRTLLGMLVFSQAYSALLVNWMALTIPSQTFVLLGTVGTVVGSIVFVVAFYRTRSQLMDISIQDILDE